MNENDWQTQTEFYRQFEAAVAQAHQQWCEDPNNAFEILRSPWKTQPPRVSVHPPGERDFRDLLSQIRARQQPLKMCIED